jgi:hypothetical protein
MLKHGHFDDILTFPKICLLFGLLGVSRCDGFTKFFKEDNVDLTGGRDMAR